MNYIGILDTLQPDGRLQVNWNDLLPSMRTALANRGHQIEHDREHGVALIYPRVMPQRGEVGGNGE